MWALSCFIIQPNRQRGFPSSGLSRPLSFLQLFCRRSLVLASTCGTAVGMQVHGAVSCSSGPLNRELTLASKFQSPIFHLSCGVCCQGGQQQQPSFLSPARFLTALALFPGVCLTCGCLWKKVTITGRAEYFLRTLSKELDSSFNIFYDNIGLSKRLRPIEVNIAFF